MVFAMIEITTYETMAPEYLGPDLITSIQQRIYLKYQGQYHSLYGYVITILKIVKMDSGYVLDRGQVLFKITFNALVFKPVQDEVMYGIVGEVNQAGIYANIGPMVCVIPKALIPSDMEYSPQEKAYVDKKSEEKISENVTIRLKITMINAMENSLRVCATIQEDYLGLMALTKD